MLPAVMALNRWLAIGWIGSVLAGGLMPCVAEAALSVGPSRIVVEAKPSTVHVGFFTLQNQGDAPLDVKVEPEEWSAGAQGGRGVVSWLTVKPEQVILNPGAWVRVKYTVRVPQAARGELRAQVFFTTEQPVPEGTTPVRSRLGTIIYVAIEGTERIDGIISDVPAIHYTASTEVSAPDRLDVVIKIRNRGNTHLVPEGTVVLRDQDVNVVAEIQLPPGWGLLPGEEDLYHAIGHGVYLKPGRYTVQIHLVVGKDVHQELTVMKTVEIMVDERRNIHLITPAQ